MEYEEAMKKLDVKLKAVLAKENMDYKDIKEFFKEDEQLEHANEVDIID